MNRTLKRVLGLAGSVALGLAGAVAIGSAAQAHHPDVTGSPTCLPDGNWQVVWSVVEGDWQGKPADRTGVISKVQSSSDAELVGDFSLSTVEGDNVQLPDPALSEAPLEATQIIDASVESVKLKVSTKWNNGAKDGGQWIEAKKPMTDCAPDEPSAEPAASALSDCLGLNVTVANNSDVLAEFVLTPSNGDSITVTPEKDAPVTEFFPVDDPEAGLTVVVTTGEEEYVFEWDGGGNCEWGVVYDTCEGLEFELSVPEDGTETTITLTPSEGDEVVVTLAPGETETVVFTASGDELTVSYLIDDGKAFYEGEVPWTKPEGCDEATPSEAPTSPAAQLPTTGSSMTIMISAAAALVLAAAVLFLIARRRRAAADW